MNERRQQQRQQQGGVHLATRMIDPSFSSIAKIDSSSLFFVSSPAPFFSLSPRLYTVLLQQLSNFSSVDLHKTDSRPPYVLSVLRCPKERVRNLVSEKTGRPTSFFPFFGDKVDGGRHRNKRKFSRRYRHKKFKAVSHTTAMKSYRRGLSALRHRWLQNGVKSDDKRGFRLVVTFSRID